MSSAYALGYFLGVVIFGVVPIILEIMLIIDGCKSEKKSTKAAAIALIVYMAIYTLLVIMVSSGS